MKKSLLALAVLGAFAGVASAQSSVKLEGTIDLSGKYVKNDGSARRLSLSQDGINSSQLRFSGIEDLGAGLKAKFVLNSGVNADNGTTQARFWHRQATVALAGNFGEVRLGRDYTPTFWNNTIFDAFGTNGLGDSTHVQQLAVGTFVRADNSIGYFLPSGIGGVYGQAMVAASEGAGAGSLGNPGRYIGGRIGFAAGPFDVAFAAAQQRLDTVAGQPNQKTYNIGGSFDFGVAKILGYFDRDTLSALGVNRRENRFSVSGVIPVGQGEIHVGGEHSKLTTTGLNESKATQYALGYVYNLSKRTAVYTNVAYLKNSGAARNSVTNGTLASPGSSQTLLPTAGGNSRGAEFGVRHFF
jgi:predicted porin